VIVLTQARAATARWLALVDRITPAELLDVVFGESAHFFETGARARRQARELQEASWTDPEDSEPGIRDARADRRSS
jgi:hypothetical protein